MSTAYRCYPTTVIKDVQGQAWTGRDTISHILSQAASTQSDQPMIIAAECYQGVFDEQMYPLIHDAIQPDHVLKTSDLLKSPQEIDRMVERDLTDDRVFGHLTLLQLLDFFDPEKVRHATDQLHKDNGTFLIYGHGATLLTKPTVLIYLDMPRWEIQMRYRQNAICNLGVENHNHSFASQYKRGFFVDWRVLDRHKKRQIQKWDFVLDSTKPDEPKLVTGDAYRKALEQLCSMPFSPMPFFDPGPWGGQWMRKVCGLDEEPENYAWCFNCVPEENSLLLKFGSTTIETPAINLVFDQPQALLGDPVHARFGDEFPIRFDFLDTMQGGNLSFQVHPLTEYIQDHFGMHYTQDESYYMMDVGPDAKVYLGLAEDVDSDAMKKDLYAAQAGEKPFDADRHAASWPVRKHDHVLIPAGTVHCSGENCMVLEISATPYIFTFKLWDWGRLGLDGLPRPIHIDHGIANIQWDRRETWVRKELINATQTIESGDGWSIEHTGLHHREFIETRRIWFDKTVDINMTDSVQVLCLVEGETAWIESPSASFEPFELRYAEVVVIPASVGRYRLRADSDDSCGPVRCGVMAAYVQYG